MQMPEILMYNLDNKKGSRLRLLCLKLHIRVRAVSPGEYGEPVGALAGMMPRTGAEAAGSFDDEMLVLVNFGSKLLNQFLQELRAAKIPGVALKAVLTPTNAEWNSVRLHEEIRREHEAMRYGGPAHPPAGK